MTITIDDDLLSAVDRLAEDRGYQSRSEAIRDIVRETLTGKARTGSREPCIAALSYVYDHHKRDLARRLTRSQHHHHDVTVAAIHVHLDQDTCLESLILRGSRGAIEALADEITSQRGVRHGHLHILPATNDPV